LKKNLNLIRVENSVQRRGKVSHEETSESTIFDQNIERATAGLEPYFQDQLKTKISTNNSTIIARYILSMRAETNLSDNHRRGVITSLKLLSEFTSSIPFLEMTREEILQYLDSLRKSDASDNLHRWVSTSRDPILNLSPVLNVLIFLFIGLSFLLYGLGL